MTEAVLYLALAYAALGVVVLGLNVYSRWPLWVKLGSIAVVTGFYFVTWQSLQGVLGWPARVDLPDRFILLSTSIHEPNKSTGEPGRVHLWVTPVGADDRPMDQPRAFELPYDDTLHSRLEEAKKEMRNGVMQIGKAEPSTGEQEDATDTTRFSRREQDVSFEKMPDPALPEK